MARFQATPVAATGIPQIAVVRDGQFTTISNYQATLLLPGSRITIILLGVVGMTTPELIGPCTTTNQPLGRELQLHPAPWQVR